MALNNQRINAAAFGASQADIEVGLRAYMLKVYNLMALGVAFTGLITLFMANNPALTQTLAIGPMKWVFFIALMAMGWFSPKIMTMQSTTAAQAFFWVYCALWGIMISPMIMYFMQTPTGVGDIARAFFITAGAFAGLSLYGYSTKRNLGPIATFASMAIIGLMIAGIVNMIFFSPSEGFSLFYSVAAVLLFSAVTAYQVQEIKSFYYSGNGDAVINRFAIFGALQLYGSFIVLFIHILNLIGMMRRE